MCGIVGYVGPRKAVPILMEGLKRLEYRGYDSAGIALQEPHGVIYEKAAGKIGVLDAQLAGRTFDSSCGIAHTRWATHGEPNDNNAHPHTDCSGKIAVVHNGIIENFRALREVLSTKGHSFSTDTDTEVIAHLVEEYFEGNLVEAVRTALSQVEGTYGVAVINQDAPNEIVGSPRLVLLPGLRQHRTRVEHEAANGSGAGRSADTALPRWTGVQCGVDTHRRVSGLRRDPL